MDEEEITVNKKELELAMAATNKKFNCTVSITLSRQVMCEVLRLKKKNNGKFDGVFMRNALNKYEIQGDERELYASVVGNFMNNWKKKKAKYRSSKRTNKKTKSPQPEIDEDKDGQFSFKI